jgi:hypothetical protein
MERRIYDRLVQSQIVRDYETFFAAATGLTLKLIPKDPGFERIPVGPCANPFCALLASNCARASTLPLPKTADD